MNHLPPVIELRSMNVQDIPGGLRLSRLAGWNQLARDWQQFLDLEPVGATAAVRQDLVIGTAATVRYGRQFAWIGMVLVDPAERGRGLGTTLLVRALDLLSDMPAVRLDATPAGEPLYRKLGFLPEYRLRRMQGTARAGGDGVGAVRPMAEHDLPYVSAIDASVFGADRGDMLRWLWSGAPEYAWVLQRGAAIGGYSFGRHGSRFEHLGPIVADDPAAARQLAGACLARHTGQSFIVDAACHSPAWDAALHDLGFAEQRPFTRMHRGGAPPFGRPERQFAMLGPEFG